MSFGTTQDGLAAHLRRAQALHQSGRLDEAELLYRDVLRVNKRHPDALHLLALLTHQRGDTSAALLALERALKARPRFAAAQNSRGLMLMALGRANEALASFDRALAVEPSHALAAFNRGHALMAFGRLEDAVLSYERALAIDPAFAEGFRAMAAALQRLGRPAAALDCYDRALASRPDAAEVLNDRGVLLDALGRPDEALADYARAVRVRPGFAEALNNQGALLDRLGRHDEALDCFRRAVAARPGFAGALMNLADMLYQEGRRAEAVDAVERRLRLDPSDLAATFARAVYQLPVLYEREAEIAERRAAYADALDGLDARLAIEPRPERFAEAAATAQPFFLAYQAQLDLELARRWGAAVALVASDAAPTTAPKPAAGERIRVGIVSGFFRQHPVWRIATRGWVTQFDRARFELIGFHTGGLRDAETELAAERCDRFIEGGFGLSRWRETVLEQAPHVLLYPEISMDRVSAWLAAHRLAPLQCCSWGHPDTTGLPTMDAFLSSDAMEPADGEAHYSERLVRLPGLGMYYEPRALQPVPLSRADLGLREGVPVFWCGQSLYKYLPQFDEVFPRIAEAVGDCQFAWIQYHRGNHVNDAFRRRLRDAFAARGLDADRHCVLWPRLDGARFVAAAGLCDVGLDSIGWSGGNTTLEAFLHDLPVVTWPGALMRSRHTTAFLETMGVRELLAGSLDEYVAIGSRLATEPGWRDDVRGRIRARQGQLYRTEAPIEALMAFIERELRSP